MKVAFLAPYHDGTGYANAAIEYIMSLDAVGINVVTRPVKMTPTTGEIPDRIKELEKKNLDGVDVVFNLNLPSEFAYKGGVKNVGCFYYETTWFPNVDWKYNLDLMDQ